MARHALLVASLVGAASAWTPGSSSRSTMRRLSPRMAPKMVGAATAVGGVGGIGVKSEEGLDERYAAINSAQAAQQANYDAWVKTIDDAGMVAAAAAIGIDVNLEEGSVSYAADFESKRTPLDFDLLYCRHGKTTGNTEPRVYQGFVDEPSNALNEIGLQQAEDAADLLDGMGLSPDLIVLSPLSRAAETGRAYVRRHPELEAKTEVWDDTAEQQFGVWDNLMVKDLEDDNICHLFYLTQNAVVKADEPYVDPSTKQEIPSENFVELLVRMNQVLIKLNEKAKGLEVSPGNKRPLICMYGHSMAGAAISVLTANGKQVDGRTCLGFDGKYIMPNATPVFLEKQE